MRNIVLSALASLFLLCSAGLAEASSPSESTQCSIDTEVTGEFFYAMCPLRDKNNQLIDLDHFNGARLEPAIHLSETPLFVHGKCRYVDSLGMDSALFIPFNSAQEWDAFLANVPSTANVAECCVPRTMKVTDVKKVTASCSAGSWKFTGLVDASDHSSYIAKAVSSAANADLAIFENNALGSMLSLPIARDDVGKLSPMIGDVESVYVARWVCGSDTNLSGHFGVQPVSHHSGGHSVTATAASGDVMFVEFNMQCKDTKWTTATSCVDSAVEGTETCQEAGHPANWTGTVHIITHNVCQSDGTVDSTITISSDSCKAPTSGNCVAGPYDTFTEACPDGDMDGIITKSHVRECPSGNVGVVQVSNTCTCVPTKDLGNVTKVCGDGQYGSIIVHQVRTCIDSSVKETFGRIPVGKKPSSTKPKATTADVTDTCSCTVAETLVSNTCKTCVPKDVTSTKACPKDYSGQIIVHNKHLCDGSNGGAGQDVVTEDNQCKLLCVPTDPKVEDKSCPDGYEGYIRITTTHVCDGSNGGYGQDVVTTDNQCKPVCHCRPSETHVDSACPEGEEGYIRTTTKHICDGSNHGMGRDEITTDNQCHHVCHCKPSVSMKIEDCALGYVGGRITKTEHICDGSNNGMGRDEVTVTGEACHRDCKPNMSITVEDCAPGYIGGRTTTTNHICDGSNDGAGRDEVKVTGEACHRECHPSSSIKIEDCAPGYIGGRTTKTEHICDGSNNGFGRDEVTVTGEACHPDCKPSEKYVDGQCPAGYSGYTRTTTKHVCDGSNGGFGQDIVTTDNQCKPICNPSQSVTTAACPAGYTGQIVTTTAHICDGSNGGFGRDTVTVSNQCTIIIISGEGGGDGTGSSGSSGDSGSSGSSGDSGDGCAEGGGEGGGE